MISNHFHVLHNDFIINYAINECCEIADNVHRLADEDMYTLIKM